MSAAPMNRDTAAQGEEQEPCARPSSLSYRSVNAYAFSKQTDYQRTFGNFPVSLLQRATSLLGMGTQKTRVDILYDCEGLVRSGEMLLVLGRPGSGCSTLLRTIVGETQGFNVGDDAVFNYQGLSAQQVQSTAWGECSYQAELDVHFPTLTTCETVTLCAEARGTPKKDAHTKAKTILDELGLLHAADTRVGNEEIPGISGGERKRLSIAEVLSCSTSLQCWDNSTRGLDSENSLQFIQNIRKRCNQTRTAAIVSLYQASDDVFNLFNNVCVLYEGHMIFFGPLDMAHEYFVRLGFRARDGETKAEFLTGVTNPARRDIQPGYEESAPLTPSEMAAAWKGSLERAELLTNIAHFEEVHPITIGKKGKTTYRVSFIRQIHLCLLRGFIRLRNDLAPPISNLVGNCILGIVLGTVFFNLPNNTDSFFARSALLFFATLLNAFVSGFEPGLLWESRPIVQKHHRYMLYKPIADAIASMLTDLPNKLLFSLVFNIPIYFLSNLRRSGPAFLTFWLFSITCLLTMSMIFRTIGSWCSTLAGSMAPAALFMLLLMIYSGFPLPVPYMRPWLRWFNYINPVAYTFESLMINEFSGREFACSFFVPRGASYGDSPVGKTCSVVGAKPGVTVIRGEDHIRQSYSYRPEHLWRNLGILVAIMVFACWLHLLGANYATMKKSRGEVLLFKDRKASKTYTSNLANGDTRSEKIPIRNDKERVESGQVALSWDQVTFDLKVGKSYKRILDKIDGWIEHGTLTALMGESGAGKTTLLNVLAGRASVGVIRGDMMINPEFASDGYARKIGYAQQMDIHLPTATVREALQFSAILRQPEAYSREDRLIYVENVIASLRMDSFSDAVVGVQGEGLNVEQRKRFTIGIELAARPELLLFLDEPTSGLDSDTAWAICSLLRQLADDGQAILCTVHQPSQSLFAMFDRLLLLRQGRCMYFGDIGTNARTLIRYFQARGAQNLDKYQNPAEWFMHVVNDPDHSIDWADQWNKSSENKQVKTRIQALSETLHKINDYEMQKLQFATSFWRQLVLVTSRLFRHYWRTPTYLYSKAALCFGSALVIGISFWLSPATMQGVQNEIFAVFLLMTIFTNLDQQIIPHFAAYRSIYETREGPSRMYSWVVFLLANLIVEIVWQTVMAILLFLCWYYPIGMYRNNGTTQNINQRSAAVFLYIWSFMQFTLTLSYLVVAGLRSAPTAVNIAQLLYSLSLIFCGVLAKPSILPRFWKFMYWSTPLTYYTSGLISVTLGDVKVSCSTPELIPIPLSPTRGSTPNGTSCQDYLGEFVSEFGGYLVASSSEDMCSYCPVTNTRAILESLEIRGGVWWRLAVTFGYVLVNAMGTFFVYWLTSVRSTSKVKRN